VGINSHTFGALQVKIKYAIMKTMEGEIQCLSQNLCCHEMCLGVEG
jgi:hypothetical protein